MPPSRRTARRSREIDRLLRRLLRVPRRAPGASWRELLLARLSARRPPD